jgi:hypothetical protein
MNAAALSALCDLGGEVVAALGTNFGPAFLHRRQRKVQEADRQRDDARRLQEFIAEARVASAMWMGFLEETVDDLVAGRVRDADRFVEAAASREQAYRAAVAKMSVYGIYLPSAESRIPPTGRRVRELLVAAMASGSLGTDSEREVRSCLAAMAEARRWLFRGRLPTFPEESAGRRPP